MTDSHTESNGLKWLMFLLSALFYFYGFLLQVSSSVMVPELMRAFHADATAIGSLSAFFFYTYAAMQIPVGILLDKFGSRKLLTLACIVCAVGSFVFADADHMPLAQFGRALIGLGAGFAAVGCLNIAAMHFPAKRFALLTGLMVSLGMVGAICGTSPLAWLIVHIHWRNTMMLLGGFGALLAAAIWFIVRDIPHAHADTLKEASLLTGLKYIVRQPVAWVISLYGGLMFAPTSAFASLWGTSYLISLYDISRPHAASMNALIFVGWLVMSPFSGTISDGIGKRLPLLWTGSIGLLSCIAVIVYFHHLPFIMMGITLFAFGVFSSCFLPAFAVMKEVNLPAYSGTAMGFMNTLNMASGALLQPLIGYFLDSHWQGQMHNGVRMFSHHTFVTALSSLTLCAGLAIVLLPFIRETHCKGIAQKP